LFDESALGRVSARNENSEMAKFLELNPTRIVIEIKIRMRIRAIIGMRIIMAMRIRTSGALKGEVRPSWFANPN
jgi:hypothetical protein